jgi:hypothetical protein
MAEPVLDLVLETRLALLRSSLSTVKKVLADIDATRQPNASVVSRNDALFKLTASVRDALFKLRALVPNDMPDLARDISGVLNPLEQALFDAQTGTAVVGPQPLMLERTSIDIDLIGEVNERLKELAVIEKSLAEADAQRAPAERERLLKAVWEQYATFHDDCEGVFAEYVDLVRGVLLRDAGLDRDLCRIGDELVRSWGRFKGYNWQSFTIPASRERQSMSAASLIRIGFPEWSIWSLALTAQEYGYVFAAKHPQMQEVVVGNQVAGLASEEEIRTWVADAFATGVMGPAYVWAAILLRADPSSPQDHARVEVMLKTLAASDPDEMPAEERERLRDAWKAARARAPSSATIGSELDRLMAVVVSEVLRWAPEGFGAADWERALDLADQLKDQGRSPEAIAEPLQRRDLRHVLSAAWRARLSLADLGRSQEWVASVRQDKLGELAERTRAICVALIDRPTEQAGKEWLASSRLGQREEPSANDGLPQKRLPKSVRVP